MEPARLPRPILLVDDDADLVDSLALLLRGRGFAASVWRRSDGVAEEAARLSPGLILLDLMLEPGGGRRALGELKADARVSAIPVLVMTGLADEAVLQGLLALGAEGVLRKPFDTPRLLATIQSHIQALGRTP